jgi:hypothetical protein
MTADKTYNGYTNYETWAVSLWIDNDEGLQTLWTERAQGAYDDADGDTHEEKVENAQNTLREHLKDDFEETMPDLGPSLWADLLNAAMSEVNWHEIAGNMLENVEQPEAEEDEATDE